MNLKLVTVVLLSIVLFFLPSVHAIQGDVNGDGKVDIFDAIALGHSLGTVPGSPNYNPSADLNSDGKIDIFDALVLASYFGKT